jgi:hypothetical protein
LDLQLRAAFAKRSRNVLSVDVAPELPYQDAMTAIDGPREAGVETVAWVPRRSEAGER